MSAAPATDGGWKSGDVGEAAEAGDAGETGEADENGDEGEADSAPGSPVGVKLDARAGTPAGSPLGVADGREPNCGTSGGMPGATADADTADANPPAIRSGSVTGWSTGREGGRSWLMAVVPLAMLVIETSGAMLSRGAAPSDDKVGASVAGAESGAEVSAVGVSAANEGEADVVSGGDVGGSSAPGVARSAADVVGLEPESPARFV